MPATGLRFEPEWSILLTACSVGPADDKRTRLRTLLRAPVRWEKLLTLAERHGTQPLLYDALQGCGEMAPAGEMRRLQQAYQTNLHKSLLLSRELIRIIRHLAELRIRVMPYKGLALAETLYGDIALRQTGDIDLLTRPEDLGGVREALAAIGYSQQSKLREIEENSYVKSGYEHVFRGAAGPNILEVQWAFQPRFYAVDFDMNGVFERVIRVNVASQSMNTPSHPDQLLTLSVHAAKHVWGRLVWLCDLARLMILPGLDWNWIASQAEELGIVRILGVTMLAASRLLSAEIPAAAQAILARDPAASRFAHEVQTYITSDAAFMVESPSYFKLMMRLRERPIDRMRFLSRLVLTPGPSEWHAVRLPGPLFPLYRLVRFSRLAARMVGASS
jgi:hypothetical protein